MFRKKVVNRVELLFEMKLLAKLRHPHIVKFRKGRENSKHLFLEMEVLKGGTLKDRFKSGYEFTEEESVTVMR
jgi:serine/threonine protein kinase